MKNSNYLPRWAISDGDELLQEGLNHYSNQMLKMASEHRADLALIVAAMKLSAPALERHLHDAEKAVLDMLMAHTVTVDLTNLHQKEAGDE